jgi:hypothetical protein
VTEGLPPIRVNVLVQLSRWPVFRCPPMAGFGCPPRLQPPAEIYDVAVFKRSSPMDQPIVLGHGLGTECGVSAELKFRGLLWGEIQQSLDLTNLKVTAIDSFGGAHLLSVRQQELLRKP